MKKRLETEKQATSLAISGIIKKCNVKPEEIKILETQHDGDSGDWYVALGFADRRVVIRMDSVNAVILELNEI